MKNCETCKEEIAEGVCGWYVTYIYESGLGYECPTCFTKKAEFDYQREKYTRKILQEILIKSQERKEY